MNKSKLRLIIKRLIAKHANSPIRNSRQAPKVLKAGEILFDNIRVVKINYVALADELRELLLNHAAYSPEDVD